MQRTHERGAGSTACAFHLHFVHCAASSAARLNNAPPSLLLPLNELTTSNPPRYWDPFYYRHRRERMSRGEGMGFLEAIFSFVFGDGNPNEDYDRRRWQLVGVGGCGVLWMLAWVGPLGAGRWLP